MPTTATTTDRSPAPARTNAPERTASPRHDRSNAPVGAVQKSCPARPTIHREQPRGVEGGASRSATGRTQADEAEDASPARPADLRPPTSQRPRATRAVPPPPLTTSDPGAYDALAALDDDPELLCLNLAHCVVEILAGARALDQIGRWVTDAVFLHLLRRTVLAARARSVAAQEAMRPRFRLGAPVLGRPADGVIEAVVVVHQTSRSRAVAVRLERHRSRWRATAISVL
ncbi:hypothetical protein IT072_06130 [Leifsonia sp. ZF2019]|uniref:Rv3235 family protein n=1 Tax=Leifsonia sp. ZF2019 TaxID=2781978 RepID=UPI001CBC9459|nr:Rv3235 family protein [Leifsonia sp. ZF2019]UAJ80597.1 hypothetical protein IT072_06130 [Leifsonia sp. ZF2019]